MCYDIDNMDLSYLAGFFDGEGSILIRRAKNTFSVLVQVTNTNLPILEQFEKRFGGHIYKLKIRSIKHTQCYLWKVSSQKANFLIKTLQPFLVLKKEQADLALELQGRIKLPGYRLNSEEIEVRQQMRQKMHDLKTN